MYPVTLRSIYNTKAYRPDQISETNIIQMKYNKVKNHYRPKRAKKDDFDLLNLNSQLPRIKSNESQ